MTITARRTPSSRLRGALKAGTILGAGLLAQTSAGWALNFSYEEAVTNYGVAISQTEPADDNLGIFTSAPVRSNGDAAIVATRGSGSIYIDVGNTVEAGTTAISASRASGA